MNKMNRRPQDVSRMFTLKVSQSSESKTPRLLV